MVIPDDKIEEIRNATDIVDVVGDFVSLKKRGSKFWGLCPFHSEKTPSFSVDPDHNMFYCFGCHKGGDVFTFVKEVDGVGFMEAVKSLAARAGVILPERPEQVEQANEVESIYNALRFAGRFFFRQLTTNKSAAHALDYLRERGFTKETIKSFGLGYAVDGWAELLTAAEAEQIPPGVLEKAGLVIRRKDGDGYYDRYRGRVIFPIFSHVGKILGFGGRILTNQTDQPKYINSPETKVYNKRRVLYGLYQGKKDIRRREEAILVEGYTDVISLHQAEVGHVVASSGTALTSEQVRMLGRYARRVLLLYDADTAGLEATLRGIDMVLAHGLAVYAVALPAGEDPDSYVRNNGGEAFVDYVDTNRQDFVTYLYERARRSGALDSPEGEAETQRTVLRSLTQIADPLVRESYLRRASAVLSVPDMQLRKVFSQLSRGGQRRHVRERISRVSDTATADDEKSHQIVEQAEALPQEKILLRLMLELGAPMLELILGNMALEEFTVGPARQLAGHLLKMYENDKIETEQFVNGSHGVALQQLASEVMMDLYEPSENWELRQNIPVPRLNEDAYEAAASAMVILKRIRVDAAIHREQAALYQVQQRGEDIRPVQERMMALHQMRKQIDQRAFLNWNAGAE